jgi:hypothetical protein
MTHKFRFRMTDTVGVADAELDHAFLDECFVDTGEVDVVHPFKLDTRGRV